jgi:iron-sulfur cluster assembly accessory protein
MITLTPKAIEKLKEFLAASTTVYSGIRVGVLGGGCSGFQYKMMLVAPEDVDPDWEMFDFDGVKVYVDMMSAMYIEGVEIDYVEQLDGSGFKFNNPNVKHTCGCGQSFGV